MVNDLPIHCFKSACSVRHEAFALGSPDFGTKVSLVRVAEYAVPFTTLGGVAGHDEVSNFEVSDALADALNHSGGLVSEDGWEGSFWVLSC